VLVGMCLFPPWVQHTTIQEFGGMVRHGPGLAPTVGPVGTPTKTTTCVYHWAFGPPVPPNTHPLTLARDFNPPDGYPMVLQLLGWPPHKYRETIGVLKDIDYEFWIDWPRLGGQLLVLAAVYVLALVFLKYRFLSPQQKETTMNHSLS